MIAGVSVTFAAVDDEAEQRLYLVLLVFVDRGTWLRFEHGIASGIDEEDALSTAMEEMGENHRGEVLLERHARELTDADVLSLIEVVEPEPAVSRKISRVGRLFALLSRWMR